MAVQTLFFDVEAPKNMSFGVIGTLVFHGVILLWLAAPMAQKIIAAEQYSAPTNVSIRFITPQKIIKPQPHKAVVKKVELVKKPKPIAKRIAKARIKSTPQELNKIEPAAAPLPVHEPQKSVPVPLHTPVQNSIPVVSDTKIKGRRVQPVYPERALRLRQEGLVWLRVLISESGKRQDIKLHKPSQYSVLNQAALKAVKKWTFDPNIVNGRGVKTWVEIPIEFKLQNKRR